MRIKKNRMVVAKSSEERNGELLFNGYRVLLRKIKKLWQWMVVMAAQH